MNALKITLEARYPLRLPLSYSHVIQGMLYNCLKESLPGLHDSGWTDGNRVFRMFTFGQLQGKYTINGIFIVFEGPVKLEIRSASPEIIDAIAEYLLVERSVRFGKDVFPIINLEASNRLLFTESSYIKMVSYLTVHTTTEDGKTIYYSPFDEEFEVLIRRNTEYKLRAAGLNTPDKFRIVPDKKTIRKKITRFKGIIVEGYVGCFMLETSIEAITLLYYAGLGDRNSQGFGMFEVIE